MRHAGIMGAHLAKGMHLAMHFGGCNGIALRKLAAAMSPYIQVCEEVALGMWCRVCIAADVEGAQDGMGQLQVKAV